MITKEYLKELITYYEELRDEGNPEFKDYNAGKVDVLQMLIDLLKKKKSFIENFHN